MPRIDVVDEGIIDADPSTVFKALIDSYDGRTHWWMPYLESKPREGKEVGQVGSVTDITVHAAGTTKFTCRTTENIEGKLLKFDYVEGDFLGNGEWSLEPTDGKTKVRFRWNVVPQRWLYKILVPLVKRSHTHVMQEGYKGLNRYLTQK